jgi:hypothetical protein
MEELREGPAIHTGTKKNEKEEEERKRQFERPKLLRIKTLQFVLNLSQDRTKSSSLVYTTINFLSSVS